MGLAQTSMISGELEKSKEVYSQILESQPNQEIQIQVWQELAQIAQEQQSTENVLLAWRNILQFSVDDDAFRSEANTSIARALAEMNRLDEAISECELNLSTAESQLQCAIILEMAQDERALDRYLLVANNDRVPDVLRSEAALGAARLTPIETRATICESALELSQMDPIVELQILQLYLETPLSDEVQTKWQTRQEQLAQGSPDVLVQYLMERTTQLRSDGALTKAIQVMEKGLRGLPPSASQPLELELGDMLLEANRASEALAVYKALLDSSADPRLTRAGMAAALMIDEQWEESLETLSQIPTEMVTGTEIHMVLEINRHHPTAEGLELSSKWATQAPNPDVQWEALMNQAQSAIGEDETERALNRFQAAADIAIEERQREWAQLGVLQARSTLGENVDNLANDFVSLQQSEDQEVRIQAHIQLAQVYLQQDKPSQVIDQLGNVKATELGAGWEMTLEEVRALAYLELNDFELARSTMTDLQNRWPDEEQVQIPSTIVLIQVYEKEGNLEQAQAHARNSLDIVTDPVYKDMLTELLTRIQ